MNSTSELFTNTYAVDFSYPVDVMKPTLMS